jgi:hypothetical protein
MLSKNLLGAKVSKKLGEGRGAKGEKRRAQGYFYIRDWVFDSDRAEFLFNF